MKAITEYATYREIMSQPAAWQGALNAVNAQGAALLRLWNGRPFRQAIFTGCGSSYYLALAAAALWQELQPVPARGVPAGELFLHPRASAGAAEPASALLVAFSRSGATTETVAATADWVRRGGSAVVFTNEPDSALAGLATVLVAVPEGREESVAQTRSFASLYVAATALTFTVARRADLLDALQMLPAAGARLLERYEPLARRLGENLDLARFYFLGSGPRYGLACEASLKMKEMTLTDGEPFHFLEFRHGPMAMIGRQAAVVGLLGDGQRRHEQAVLAEMAELGGFVLTQADADADVAFASRLPAPARHALHLPVLQTMACYRALAKGLNPDRPTHLTAVVELTLDKPEEG